MTDKQQPEALLPPDIFGCDPAVVQVDAATTQQLVLALKIQHAELETLTLYKNLADEYGLSIFPDIAEMTAELETLRAKLKVYEDLGGAADDVQLLRMGYAAARLEIESLRDEVKESRHAAGVQKTLIETLLAEKPAEAQQPGAAYAALPEPITYQIAVLKACEHGDALVGWRVEPSRQSFDASMRPKRKLYTEGNMHDFADRTHALRASHGQAPAQAAPQQEAHHLAQALTDRENQPNQYGVEFGMSGTHMHFKIGNQLFKLAYEPDEQEEFDFMKRMLVNAFTTFTHDVKTAPQPSLAAQGDALPREDFAWLVVQEACETEPADEDDPECVRILRRDLKSSVLAAFLRLDAARAAQEGKSCQKE